MQKLFILAVGGTGARVLRSFLMLLASNVELKNISEVIPILIDLDKDNGDTQRTLQLLEEYHKISNTAYKNKKYDGFFQQPIKPIHGLVDGNSQKGGSNFFMHFAADNMLFSKYIGYQSLCDEDKSLIEVLYNTADSKSVNAELNLNLSVGFKGNPNIGSVVLNEINDTPEFKQLETSYTTGDKIFIIGSLFGGTGASGLPHLVRKIRKSTKGGINEAEIGTVAVMPYFKLQSDPKSAISSLTFASKTKAALSYYANEMDGKITSMYYIGDETGNSYKNNEGGKDQKNKAHLIELLSAMSIFRFAELPQNTQPTIYNEFGVDAISGKMQISNFNDKTKDSFFVPLTKFFLLSKLFTTELDKVTDTVFYKRLELENNLKNDSFYTSFAFFINGFWSWLEELESNDRSFTPFLLNGSFNEAIQGGKKIKDSLFCRSLTTQIKDRLTRELIELEREEGDDGKGLSDSEKRVRKIQHFVQSTYVTFDKIYKDKIKRLPSQQNADGASNMFKLHLGGTPNLKDWDKSSLINDNIIQTIKDKIKDGAGAKVATSIPTPFARIRLFDTAFKIVNSNRDGPSVYEKLVSDCLDVFQMVFILGNNQRLKFSTWNKTTRLQDLKNANSSGNKKLGNALEFFFGENAFANFNELQFIYLDDKLVGGTSPFTMFFTSPNWKANNQNTVVTPTGRKLFFDEEADLGSRDIEFQKYLYRFKKAYGANLDDSDPLKAFFNYIDTQTAQGLKDYISENKAETSAYTLQSWMDDISYASIAIQANRTLKVGNCEIKTTAEGIIHSSKQEMWIFPTVRHYEQRYDNVPLFLLEGNHSHNYFQTKWSSDIEIDQNDIRILIGDRMVPGFDNVNYPYLSDFDFFADKVIRLPYNLNEEQFEVVNGQGNILLPISRTYFDFFEVADLRKNLTIEDKGDEIIFRLAIPIQGANFDGTENLVIEKIYLSEDIFSDDNAKSHIGLGVFPFYKITDETPNAQKLNEYNLMLVHGKDVTNPNLNVFKFTNPIDNISLQSSVRSKIDENHIVSTIHYNLTQDYFDFGEIQVESAKGLFIPKFKEVSSIVGSTEYLFAVDFGTSNTHICYSKDDKADLIKSFEVEKNDKQVIFLHEEQEQKKDLLGNFVGGVEYLGLEFMPEYIGEKHLINYPIKTALYESDNFKRSNPVSIFSHANIAFDIKEIGQNKIITDIKWTLEKNLWQSQEN